MSNRLITLIQYMFITVDILCNAFSDYFSDHLIRQLSIFVMQDLCLVLSLIILLLYYFNVDALRTGTLALIFRRYWSSLVLTIVYILLTITLQLLLVKLNWSQYKGRGEGGGGRSGRHSWKSQSSIVSLFVIQRVFSAFYYFSFAFTLRKLQSKRLIEKLTPKS
ncbi:uncharacterized protein LOC128962701 [Oppia nitens]|uniref:uncharacterized protein LOC128962701 n=1 Tax=Oppia nitens TaxID=1686743 RepID=UPI0023DB32BC|nr:uncharacterized protein LOC128962701 [Oppia nitens]